MGHPFLHLLLTQPGLVAEHGAGYAEMLGQELGVASGVWRKRVLLAALGLFCAVVAVVLAGVALMLWAAGYMAPGSQPWVLIATPLVPVVGACWCWVAWCAQDHIAMFDNILAQLKTDISIMRQEHPI